MACDVVAGHSRPIWVPDPCSFRVLDCSTNVVDVFQARQRFSRQIKWTICIGFSVDFTLNVLLALSELGDMLTVLSSLYGVLKLSEKKNGDQI
jgi:hypothetical protein